MARPTLYGEPLVKVDTKIKQSQKDELDRRNRETKRPVADYLREAIELYLDPDGNPGRVVMNFEVPVMEDLERIAKELRFPSLDMFLRHLITATRENSLNDLDAFLRNDAEKKAQACIQEEDKKPAKSKRAGARAA